MSDTPLRASARELGSLGPEKMDLSDLVKPDAILPSLKANSKKQVLQAIAEKASAMTGVPERDIFETLVKREKLGSTGVGGGIAIPHGKLASLDRIFGLFARLPRPIDFEALDEHPVDLIFLLLAPEAAGADHLKALARVARLFREPGVVGKLRASSDRDALFAVLTEAATHNAA